MGQPIEIFCCAAEADRSFLTQLRTQLSLQQQQGIITFWDETQIPAGAMADQEILRHLASARIFLLLISPDFLASDYCYNKVMKAALQRHGRGEAITIPVIVRHAIWQDGVLNHIQVLPRNGQPISGQHDRDHALWEVAKEIIMAVQRLNGPSVQPGPQPKDGTYAGSEYSTRTYPPPPPMNYPPVGGTGKISSSPRGVQKKFRAILLLTAVVLVLAGVAAFTLYAQGSKAPTGTSVLSNSSTPSATSTTPTQAATTNTSTTSTNTQPMATVAPATLPMAALSSPKLPLTIPCVNCSYPQLHVKLDKIEVDAPDQSTRWFFSFQNSGEHACSPSFWSVHLTDPSGTDYPGKGQVSSSNSLAIDATQSVREASVFAVLPASGEEYTLTLELHVGGCSGSGPLNPYQTENFTFA